MPQKKQKLLCSGFPGKKEGGKQQQQQQKEGQGERLVLLLE